MTVMETAILMNKPIKPKKPSNRENPPLLTIETDKWVAENDNGEFILLDSGDDNEYIDSSGYPNYEKLEEMGLELVNKESFKYSFIQKLYQLIDQDFSFGNSLDRDGYVIGLIVTFKIKNENYEKELELFNNRFIKYAEDLEKYNQKMIEFEEFKKQEKINQLQAELNSLKK